MKKYTTTSMIILLTLILTSCVQQKESVIVSKKKIAVVTVQDIAPNEMKQVMIFGVDENREKRYFVKEFYAEDKSEARINLEMNQYFDEMQQFRGKMVRIEYYRDNKGDMVITSIEQY